MQEVDHVPRCLDDALGHAGRRLHGGLRGRWHEDMARNGRMEARAVHLSCTDLNGES